MTDLKSGDFAKIYYVYGEEEFLIRSYKNQFLKAFGGEGEMNCSVLPEDCTVDELIDSLDTLPFFAEKRLIVLRLPQLFPKGELERLNTYLPGMPESSCFFLIGSGALDKRTGFYKTVLKEGVLCEIPYQNEKTLAGWGAGYLRREGNKKISADAMYRLLAMVGHSMFALSTELEKLLSYVGEREEIELRDVEEVVSQTAEDRVFEMVEAIGHGRREKAMRFYMELLMINKEPMSILGLIRNNMQLLLRIKGELQNHKSEQEIAAESRIHPYRVKKLAEQARNFGAAALERYLRTIQELDQAIKAGDLKDRTALEILLCQ